MKPLSPSAQSVFDACAFADIPDHEHTHSLYTHCLECGMWGIDMPIRFVDAAECGNCCSVNTVKYFPSCCIVADRGPTIRALLELVEMQREALSAYSNYDNETVRHMDTEHLPPSRVAVIKPLDFLNKGYAPDGKHPSEIHQDATLTYGPKYRPGRIARECLTATDARMKELSGTPIANPKS